MDERLRPRRWLAGLVFLAVLAAGLFWAAPALADYLGPDRTVVTWVWRRLQCHYEAVYDPPGAGWYGCTLNLYDTPDASCPSTGEAAGYFTPSACGWAEAYCQVYGCSISRSSDIVSCSEGQQGCRAVERRVTHPEATISGSIGCGTAGSGGWCRGGAELGLSGSEPLAGYEILLVEGTRNGEIFACPGASCSIPLAEGWNEFSYWALSSWGDSSRMGSASGGLDGRAPVLAGDASGTPGEGGWYVAEVTVTASASDPAPGSGLAGLEVSLDGGGWGPYGGPLVLYDGVHSVELRASDVAGNSASLSQTISVDAGAPSVALSAPGAFCPRCGESLAITVSAQDAVSGVGAWRLSADSVEIAGGGGPVDQAVSWDGAGISGGMHTLTMWARDAAGNESEAIQPLTVEVPPAPASEPTEAAALILAPPSSPTATVTRTPAPTRTAVTFTFGGLPAAPPPEEGGSLPGMPPDDPDAAPAAGTGGGSGVLWGGAALALIGLATAFAIEQAQRRKQEEAAERAEMERRNALAEARDAAVKAWQAAVAWAAAAAATAAASVSEGMRRVFDEKEERLEQAWQDDQASAEAARLEAIRLAAAVAAEARLRAVVEAREGGPPPQTPAEGSIPRPTGTPVPSSTPSPSPVPTPPATSTPGAAARDSTVSRTFPPRGYPDPGQIRWLEVALQAGGLFRVRNSPTWVSALTGSIEWGEVFAAEARTSMSPAVTTGARMSGLDSSLPTVSQPWSFPVGPVTVSVNNTPQPSLSLSYRAEGALSYHPDGGAEVNFSQSARLTSEGTLFNNAWTLDVHTFDYRVAGSDELSDLPGYAGRAGMYIKVYPVRTMIMASIYVAIGLVALELLPATLIVLPRLAEALAH